MRHQYSAAILFAVLLAPTCADTLAQGPTNRPALPPAPGEKPAIAGKGAADREPARRALVDALNESLKKLKALDAAAAPRPLEGKQPVSGAPSAQARQDAEREILASRRKLTQFDLESKCGPLDDSQEVELYNGALGPTKAFVQKHQPTTAQIQWKTDFAKQAGPNFDAGNVAGERWCSASLVSENLMLTAGHCFDIQTKEKTGWISPSRRGADGKMQKLPPRELATLMQVNFNYQTDGASGKERPSVTYPIVRLLEYREGPNELDYAVIELGKSASGDLPGKRFGRIPVDASSAALQKASLLTVIQHPSGKLKRVAAGSKIGLITRGIEYGDIDTEGGASGSGVIDQNGRVIGVHVLGGCTATGGANGAVSVEAIAAVSKLIGGLK